MIGKGQFPNFTLTICIFHDKYYTNSSIPICLFQFLDRTILSTKMLKKCLKILGIEYQAVETDLYLVIYFFKLEIYLVC